MNALQAFKYIPNFQYDVRMFGHVYECVVELRRTQYHYEALNIYRAFLSTLIDLNKESSSI